MMTDPIADMLTRIRNAQAVKHKTVDIPYSKIKYAIAKILEEEGFIEKAETKFKKPRKVIRITLKYQNGEPAISGLKRVSKPGRRVYLSAKELKVPKSGYGIGIVSTSQGLMTTLEAKKRRLGGELICEVW